MNRTKIGEMSFQDFFEKAKREGIENDVIEHLKVKIRKILNNDGFSDEQINVLKMDRVWEILVKIIGDDFELFFNLLLAI